ncbi:MAG: BtrH N-terminal domain-containing protein [Bacteroidota bacterium]
MKIEFEHIQSAHCENGVVSNLLNFNGLKKITEPLAFGIGSGLFFIYLPFIKINNCPAFSYRIMPGLIFKRTCNSLGVKSEKITFSSTEKAQSYIDNILETGKAVGCQVGVYYLTYLPKEFRFHFNAHNIVVFGKEGDTYLISDPVMESTTTLSTYELNRVRFAKGPLAPNGKIYYPEIIHDISDDQIRSAIKKGIKRNVRDMLHIPGPIVGISGIKYVGNRISKWKDKYGLQTAGAYLAQIVRMQEEIGTGGGGFRFIYAAFLQEAFPFLPKDELLEISTQFTKSGDLWRSFAVQAAGVYKGRLSAQADFDLMKDQLHEIAEIEKSAFISLSKINLDK